MRNILNRCDCRRLAYQTWATPDESVIPAGDPYFLRKACIIELIDSGGNLGAACSSGKCSRYEVRRILRRCITELPDGTLAGFRGCKLHFRTTRYKLQNFSGKACAGALGYIFRTYPAVESKLRKFVLGTTRRRDRPNAPTDADIRKEFKELCAQAGVPNTGFPFVPVGSPIKSLWAWKKSLMDSHGKQFNREYFGDESAQSYHDGKADASPQISEFKTWVFDEYTVDTPVCVLVTRESGVAEWYSCSRFKIISGRRRGSRDIVVSLPVLVEEPKTAHIQEALEHAIRPHARTAFNIPGFSYPEKKCFASEFADCDWQIPDLVLFDRSLAHLAEQTRMSISEVLGGFIEYGVARRPKDRADIEAWHAVLAREFRKLPSTTATGPDDPRCRNPVERAIELRLTEEHITQLVELTAARFNSEHRLDSLMGSTPMEAFQGWVLNERPVLRQVPVALRDGFSLASTVDDVVIACDVESGKQPCVRYGYATYMGPFLSHMRSKEGAKCKLEVPNALAHIARLYTPDGDLIDVLTARGIWKIPHRLCDRINYSRLRNAGRLKGASDFKSPTEILRNYLANQARLDRRQALKYAEIKKGTQATCRHCIPGTVDDAAPSSTRPQNAKAGPKMKSAGGW